VLIVAVVASVICTLGGVVFLIVLVRIARGGAAERYREDAAREHFARHGSWPDEAETSPRITQRAGVRRTG